MDKLNPNSLSHIFTDTLYSIDTKPKTNVETTPVQTTVVNEDKAPEIKVLGENSNRILILSNESGSPFLSANDYTFLEKIIQATGNQLDQCAIVNTFRQTYTLQDLVTYTQAKNIVTFGINLFEIGIQDKAPLNYECRPQLNNTINLIPGENLNIISKNGDKKKALWIALKRMFSI